MRSMFWYEVETASNAVRMQVMIAKIAIIYGLKCVIAAEATKILVVTTALVLTADSAVLDMYLFHAFHDDDVDRQWDLVHGWDQQGVYHDGSLHPPMRWPEYLNDGDQHDNRNEDTGGESHQDITRLTYYYADFDGDGYGNASRMIYSDVVPSSYITKPGDCNDSNGSVHPEALDFFMDGFDQDCDGFDGPHGGRSRSHR
jgi:hypothetical protein